MSRLIDADELKELFREVIGGIAKQPEMSETLEHMVRASAMVIQMIDDASTVELEPHWITCKEAFPPVFKDVLLQLRNMPEEMVIGFWNGLVFRFGTSAMIETAVVAWMPLPEPYREGRTEVD